jgi:hypothetical protein
MHNKRKRNVSHTEKMGRDRKPIAAHLRVSYSAYKGRAIHLEQASL